MFFCASKCVCLLLCIAKSLFVKRIAAGHPSGILIARATNVSADGRAHRFEQASAANAEAISLDPELLRAYEFSGLTDYQLGNFEAARARCEARPNYWGTQWCLALAYEKLGRHADAPAAVARIQAMQGDTTAYQYSTIYAQWGDTAKALEWLETAMRLRDPGLSLLRTDPLLEPLRKEPRYQAIERELKFPDQRTRPI